MTSQDSPDLATRTGRRMIDVRRAIAETGRGLRQVEKIDAGRYVITTRNGVAWNVYLNTAGTWTGEVR